MTKKYFKNRFLPFIIIPLLFLSCKKENNKEMINSSISTNENKKLIDGINYLINSTYANHYLRDLCNYLAMNGYNIIISNIKSFKNHKQ